MQSLASFRVVNQEHHEHPASSVDNLVPIPAAEPNSIGGMFIWSDCAVACFSVIPLSFERDFWMILK